MQPRRIVRDLNPLWSRSPFWARFSPLNFRYDKLLYLVMFGRFSTSLEPLDAMQGKFDSIDGVSGEQLLLVPREIPHFHAFLNIRVCLR